MKKNYPVPYCGITGFMNRGEVNTIAKAALFAGGTETRRLMVGVLVSYKQVLNDEMHRPTRYPALDDMHHIFGGNSPRVINLVHYNTSEQSTLCSQLLRIIEYSHGLVHGFQLNMLWPDRPQLVKFKTVCPATKIVLQVNSRCMKSIEHNPIGLWHKVCEYGDLVDYVLLDLSGGRGKILDANHLLPFVEKLQDKAPRLGIVVAGGLHGGNLHILKPILDICPTVSIDAEGCLRNSRHDDMNIVKAEEYIEEARKIFS